MSQEKRQKGRPIRKKRGFFFLTDSLIAAGILIIVTSLLFIPYSSADEGFLLDFANSFLESLSSIKIGDCCASKYPDLTEYSILQAIVFSRLSGDNATASELASIPEAYNLIPRDLKWSLYFRDSDLESANCFVLNSTLETACMEDIDAKISLSVKKRIWFYSLNISNGNLTAFDPAVVEVRAWSN